MHFGQYVTDDKCEGEGGGGGGGASLVVLHLSAIGLSIEVPVGTYRAQEANVAVGTRAGQPGSEQHHSGAAQQRAVGYRS